MNEGSFSPDQPPQKNQEIEKSTQNLWKNEEIRHAIKKEFPHSEETLRCNIEALEEAYGHNLSEDEIKELQLAMMWMWDRMAHQAFKQEAEKSNTYKTLQLLEDNHVVGDINPHIYSNHDFAHGLFLLHVKDRVTTPNDNSPSPAFLKRKGDLDAEMQSAREELGPLLLYRFVGVIFPAAMSESSSANKFIETSARLSTGNGALSECHKIDDYATRKRVVEGCYVGEITPHVENENDYIKTITRLIARVIVFVNISEFDRKEVKASVEEIVSKFDEMKAIEDRINLEVTNYLDSGAEGESYKTVEEATIPTAIDELRRFYREHKINPRVVFDMYGPTIHTLAEKMKSKLSVDATRL